MPYNISTQPSMPSALLAGLPSSFTKHFAFGWLSQLVLPVDLFIALIYLYMYEPNPISWQRASCTLSPFNQFYHRLSSLLQGLFDKVVYLPAVLLFFLLHLHLFLNIKLNMSVTQFLSRRTAHFAVGMTKYIQQRPPTMLDL